MLQPNEAIFRSDSYITLDTTSYPAHPFVRIPVLLTGKLHPSFYIGQDTTDYETCSDSFANRIYEAFEQLDDPEGHTKYDTIEEFLAVLDSRINDH